MKSKIILTQGECLAEMLVERPEDQQEVPHRQSDLDAIRVARVNYPHASRTPSHPV
jgi:hypothetical protein